VPKTTLEPALERERERYFGHVLLVFTTPPHQFTINTSLQPVRFPTEKVNLKTQFHAYKMAICMILSQETNG
jgi:hypothetical protein